MRKIAFVGIAIIIGIVLFLALDWDGDGLATVTEFRCGTGVFNSDTDGDGLKDGVEVNTYESNPLASDTDEDGLDDYEEVNIYETNPLTNDSDGDGFNDYNEVHVYKTDPTVRTVSIVSVTTTPVSGAIYINGEHVGTGSASNEYPPGTCTITYGSVIGYHTPSAQTIVLQPGDVLNVVGSYVAFSRIAISTTPVDGTIYINGELGGMGSISKEYPPGTYVITFGSVAGYQTPDAQTIMLKAGDELDITASYTILPANLLILTSPVSGSIYVNGVYVGTGSASKEYSPGTYTITFGQISGYHIPSTQTVALQPGDALNIVGNYIELLEAYLEFSNIIQTVSGISPSIYCFMVNEDKPLFSVTIANTGEKRAEHVRVSVKVEGITDWQTKTIQDINSNSSINVNVTPIIPEEVVTGFYDSTYKQVSIKVEYHSAGTEMPTTSYSQSITIYSKNALPWNEALNLASKYGIPSLRYFLAYYVTPQDPTIRSLATSATTGYYLDSRKAERIFFKIGDELGVGEPGGAYASDPNDPVGGPTDYIQFPTETLSIDRGDCDDLAVLYATALEAVGIDTRLVFIPGHVFVGFYSHDTYDDDHVYAGWNYVETTWIREEGWPGTNHFREAVDKGKEEYNLYEGTPSLTLVKTSDAWGLGIR